MLKICKEVCEGVARVNSIVTEPVKGLGKGCNAISKFVVSRMFEGSWVTGSVVASHVIFEGKGVFLKRDSPLFQKQFSQQSCDAKLQGSGASWRAPNSPNVLP